MHRSLVLLIIVLTASVTGYAQAPLTSLAQAPDRPLAVIGYYDGRTTMIDSFEVEKLTHLIFSFCHREGRKLSVTNPRDSATIRRMVALRQRNPRLKIILSVGGWGGCA